MNDNILVIIHSGDPATYKGQVCYRGSCIATYDKPQWLTPTEVKHIRDGNLEVEELDPETYEFPDGEDEEGFENNKLI